MNSDSKNARKKRGAYLSVGSNTLLTMLKLVVGLFTGSISIISESLHSLNDLVAALIATYAVHQSSKPPDSEHTYGHGKIESVSALLEASLIIFAAVFIIHESIDRMINPREIDYMEAGILVMFISVCVNIYVGLKLKRTASVTSSAALEADSAHLLTDVYTALGVFIGLVVIKVTNYYILDPIIAILVAIYIIKVGVSLIIKSARELMDARISAEEEKKVRRIVNSHNTEFVEMHALRSRVSGSDRYIDMHIVVAKDTSIKKAHELADHIEKEIAEKMPGYHTMVHVEPCDENCDKCGNRKKCGKA